VRYADVLQQYRYSKLNTAFYTSDEIVGLAQDTLQPDRYKQGAVTQAAHHEPTELAAIAGHPTYR
jgi:hypothetical protein